MVDLKRLAQSLRFAFKGLKHTLLFHQNLKIHLTITVLALTLGLVFQISLAEWVSLLAAIFLVLVAEMINTAFEEVINLVKEDHSERARIAKDVSAGMVLLAAIFAVLIGAIVFLPHLR